jgi:hypothetical protein
MHRRIAALLVVGLAWALAPSALAQTSTSSTSTSSTSSTSTSSSSTSTTAPAFANPCTGQPCTERPPDAFLAGASGEVLLDRGSSCWRSPQPNAQGHFSGLCVDVGARDQDVTLAVRPDEILTLRFRPSTMTPTYVQLEREDVVQVFPPGNPVTFSAQYPAGTRPLLRFFTRWAQGDMSYSVRLDVRATAGPASPQPGTISLTG